MSYREDRETLLARNEELETELSAAHQEIARLRGGNVRSNKWLGGPAEIEVERVVPGELGESALEDLVAGLRARFGGAGRIERVGQTFTWCTEPGPRGGGRRVAVHFTKRGGSTRVRIHESLKHVAGALFGGILGGLGGAGAINLLVWSVILGNVLLLLGGVTWLALVFGAVRAGYGAFTRRRAAEIERFGAELEDQVRSASAEGEKVRVSEAATDEEVEAEEAGEAGEAEEAEEAIEARAKVPGGRAD